MYESDIKIVELIKLLKELGKIDYDYEFCDKIGLLKQNLLRIKQDKAHFTAQHIENICKVYKVNANWIFGTSKKIFNDRKQTLLKQIQL